MKIWGDPASNVFALGWLITAGKRGQALERQTSLSCRQNSVTLSVNVRSTGCKMQLPSLITTFYTPDMY